LQLPGKLAITNINADHVSGTALQQAIGKTACGCANVDTMLA
jgi:hypothetical protein